MQRPDKEERKGKLKIKRKKGRRAGRQGSKQAVEPSKPKLKLDNIPIRDHIYATR